MARNDPDAAAGMLTTIAPSLTKQEQAIAWGAIGYQGAIKRSPLASVWYAKSTNAPLSNPGYEWRTRAALLAGNWPMVRWSIEQMPPSLRDDPAWIYWHARALKAATRCRRTRNSSRSRASSTSTGSSPAKSRRTTIPPRTKVSDAEIDAMSKIPGFALAQRFYALNLRLEGNREWNWPLRG